MALPDFDQFKNFLASTKAEAQSWGNYFRELENRNSDLTSHIIFNEINQSLVDILATWDFYASESLDKAASEYGVKSWQLTEYVEAIREVLSIKESDLIVYEKVVPSVDIQAEGRIDPDLHLPNPSQSQQYGTQDPSHGPTTAQIGPEAIQPLSSNREPVTSGRTSKTVLGLTGLVSALVFVLIVFIAIIANQRPASYAPSSSNPRPTDSSNSDSNLDNPQSRPSKGSSEEVYFSGIDLPVTNTLCNKKRSFCIYGLSALVNNESGEATYSFSDVANGEQVNINGPITVSNIVRNGNNRQFTFAFRDDQSDTTPGWAAAGFFNLDQDSNPTKPGILTRFKTTESFGPKTPVGLENTSYLFPG